MPRSRPRPAVAGTPVPPPPGLRAAAFRFGGDEFVVMSLAVPRAVLPPSLSPAEREVARALLEGKSNTSIAVGRGTSPSTVANQVSSIFRKLRVTSRREFLIALLLPG